MLDDHQLNGQSLTKVIFVALAIFTTGSYCRARIGYRDMNGSLQLFEFPVDKMGGYNAFAAIGSFAWLLFGLGFCALLFLFIIFIQSLFDPLAPDE